MSAVENSSPNIAMRVAPSGGLLRSGNPGNKGGGRRPDRIKRLAAKELRKRVKLLGFFADGVAVGVGEDGAHEWTPVTVAERVSAMRELRNLATGEQVPVHEVRSRLVAQIKLLRAELDPETFERVAGKLEEVWK